MEGVDTLISAFCKHIVGCLVQTCWGVRRSYDVCHKSAYQAGGHASNGNTDLHPVVGSVWPGSAHRAQNVQAGQYRGIEIIPSCPTGKDDLNAYVHDLGAWYNSARSVSTLAPAKLFQLIKYKACTLPGFSCE